MTLGLLYGMLDIGLCSNQTVDASGAALLTWLSFQRAQHRSS
jgi:hypothetical protein